MGIFFLLWNINQIWFEFIFYVIMNLTCLSKLTPNASPNKLLTPHGVLVLSLPSKILIPSSTLCTNPSLQNFSVVSNNHCKSVSSFDILNN